VAFYLTLLDRCTIVNIVGLSRLKVGKVAPSVIEF
jgi:hypothetical protein